MIVDLIDWQAQFYRDKRLRDAELKRTREEIASRERIAADERIMRRDIALGEIGANRYRTDVESSTKTQIAGIERVVSEAKIQQEEKNRKSRILGDWLNLLGNLGKGFLGYELYKMLKDRNNHGNHNPPSSGSDEIWNNVRKSIQESEKEVRKHIPDKPKSYHSIEYDFRPTNVDYRTTLHEDSGLRPQSKFEKFVDKLENFAPADTQIRTSPVSAGAAAGAMSTLLRYVPIYL